MALDAGSVFAVLGGKFNPAGFAQFDAAMKKSTASATAAERSHARSAGAMTAMGTAAKTGAAVGIAAVGYALVKSVQSAAVFEQKMSELQAVTKANTATMKIMSKAALDLGAKTGVGATEAAGALTELAKGGLDANTSIAALSGTIALAQSGDMELADAANTVVKSLSLFSLKGADAGHVADGLASAANATSMDVKDFAQALAQGGSAAAAAGFSFDDTINIMSSMANKFQSGSDMGTSLKTTLVQMANPSKKAADEMQRLDINLFNAHGKMKPVASIVSMLSDRFKGMSDKQKLSTAATIAGTDGMRTLLALLGGSGKDIIAPGSAAEIAAKKMDNFKGASKRLASEWETLRIELGQKVTPALADATGNLADFLQQMRESKGAGGAVSDTFGFIGGIVGSSTDAYKLALRGLLDVLIAVNAGFQGLAEGAAWLGLPGADDAAKKMSHLNTELNNLRDSLSLHPPKLNVKITANKEAAVGVITAIQNSKIAPKVAKILGNSSDAKSKIAALVALGIPPKLAKILSNSDSVKAAIQRLQSEINNLKDGHVTIWQDVRTTGSAKVAASGSGAGTAHASLVGEGGGPEWIVNRDTGSARKVTGPQIANLSASEYVIPTESRYRPQALGLLSMLAADLGVQGYKKGLSAKQKKARKRLYAKEDSGIQSASDAATLYETRMNTAETSGNAGLWATNQGHLTEQLALELNRIKKALKSKFKPKGARLTTLKQHQADVEGLIATNNAAKFPAAEITTYTDAELALLGADDLAIAQAALTDTTADDLVALKKKRDDLQGIFNSASYYGGHGGVAGLTQIAGDLKSAKDAVLSVTGNSPDQTAIDQINSFVGSYHSATSQFGNNFNGGNASSASGAQVRITNNYQAPPEDPHSWSAGLAYELKAAL